ncbi:MULTISPECIES: non-ribosomal peptide synthetase [Bacillus cereus group]|uniref:Amino acid adenylation domain-containing protein n=1 Tax=Bacillus cereus TaxID=1396 RepID=A0A9W7QFT5_BACCE|nr:non-ribosomal peptide synthetase [Bacillus cereus]KAB2394959.1 amino acid adenylation domain-containing protein [Bacillus cereus]KAB2410257.1 amino acid adenylation domain-containing protein [Bacillus cereus]KAB2428796.1 amino acid adenylation domain-containing protein [Bacillus cereus]
MSKEKLMARLAKLSPEQKMFLEKQLNKNESNIIPSRKTNEPTILSFAQQRMWFLEQLEPGSSTYNMPFLVKIKGDFNINIFKRCLNEIISRHEILRTTFLSLDGDLRQKIHPFMEIDFEFHNLCSYSKDTAKDICSSQMKRKATEPFHLEKGPLLHTSIWQITEDEFWALVNMHHIIGDGWSMAILIEELSILYDSFLKADIANLSPLKIQYADFSIWQKNWLTGSKLQTQLDYWKKQFKGTLPVLDLPTDFSRPSKLSYKGSSELFEISYETVKRLKALSKSEGCTLYMTLLAAYYILLLKYTNQEDIIIGSPIANRNHREIEPLIGFFVNTLALRIHSKRDIDFRELIHKVKEICLGAYSNQDIPFEAIVGELNSERTANHSVLFQTMFSLEQNIKKSLNLVNVKMDFERFETDTAKFDLSLIINEHNDGLIGTLNYSTDLFMKSSIQQMAKHFITILKAIIENPDVQLSEISLLDDEEKNEMLIEWNSNKEILSDMCIQEKFELQVIKTPDAIAVICENDSLTYRELNNRANQVAHYLRRNGIRPGKYVGICLERRSELMISILGILKAGGAYIPLDPSYPMERLSYILKESQLDILLTQKSYMSKFTEFRIDNVVQLDGNQELNEEDTINLDHSVDLDDLAYMIYTSGSTGKPKGVMVPHRGLTNYLNWSTQNYYKGNGGQGSLVLSSISFDLTITGMFSPLCIGETVVLFPERLVLEELGGWVRKRKYSVIKLTPAHLELLSHQISEEDAAFCTDTFVVGGEPLLAKHVDFWLKHAPNTVIINEYGPTEAVVGCTNYIVKPGDNYSKSIPIGKPIFNTDMYVLDTSLQPVPIGVHGELYIGGEGLARGYYKRPELTEERFVNSPFSSNEKQKLYKTGDIVQYLPNGNLEYIDRIDQQVKLRGFRIELGEIECILSNHDAISSVVVSVYEENENKKLIAYVVPKYRHEMQVDFLYEYMKKHVPDYMIPAKFVILEELPLTPNGKIDRRRLPKPIFNGNDQQFVEPITDLEKEIAMIWGKVLGYKKVSMKDNFFKSGGESLLATKFISLVRKKLKIELPLKLIFEVATLEEFVLIVKQELELEQDEELIDLLNDLEDTEEMMSDEILSILTNHQV